MTPNTPEQVIGAEIGKRHLVLGNAVIVFGGGLAVWGASGALLRLLLLGALLVGWRILAATIADDGRTRRVRIATGVISTTIALAFAAAASGALARAGLLEGERTPIAGFSFGMTATQFASACEHRGGEMQEGERTVGGERIDQAQCVADFADDDLPLRAAAIQGWFCGGESCVVRLVSYDRGEYERASAELEAAYGPPDVIDEHVPDECRGARLAHCLADQSARRTRVWVLGTRLVPVWIRLNQSASDRGDYVFVTFVRADAYHWFE